MARPPLVLGLTGSIGMGKSTAARYLAQRGWRVFDADKAVHRLMAPGGLAVAPLAAIFPAARKTNAEGRDYLDRRVLREAVSQDPKSLAKLEAVLHPLVRKAQSRARYLASKGRCKGLVLDIPLLFETQGDQRCDTVIVVSAPGHIQQARVLRRSGITVKAFKTLLAKQMPDQEKRKRADYIIQTGLGYRHARRQLDRILRDAPASLRPRNRCRSTIHPPLFGPENPHRWTPARKLRHDRRSS